MKLKELYKFAWDKFGQKHQIERLWLEVSELHDVIVDYRESLLKGKTREELKDVVDHFAEEMVDVMIMIEAVRDNMGLKNCFSNWKNFKIKRLKKRLGLWYDNMPLKVQHHKLGETCMEFRRKKSLRDKKKVLPTNLTFRDRHPDRFRYIPKE